MGMREMKDSGIPWVGKIPSQWKTMRGKYLFTNSKEIVGTKVNEYERLALTLHGVIKRSKNDTEGLQPAEFNTYQILRKNELVFKLIDLQNISTSRIGLSPYDGIVSPAYIILKTKKNIIPAFAEKYYLMMWINHIFNALGDSGVRSSLNAPELLEINVPVPPIEEQRRIADYLDSKCAKIKSIKKNVEAEMEALKRYKQSVITEAVTKGLDKNVEMKDSGIPWVGKIPSQWKTMRGKYLFTNSKEIVGTKVNEYERLALTLHGVIKRSKNDTEGLQPAEFNTYQILRKNELVFKLIDLQNISTSRIGLSPYDGIVSPAYIILKTKKNIIPAFAEKYYLMMWINHIFNALGDSGVRSSLNAPELLEINVPIPPIKEQQKISDYLDSKCSKIDSIIQKKQELLANLDTYKKSMIYEYVTGKKEVPAV